MKYLFDTQSLVWLIEKPQKLTKEVRDIVDNNTALYVSVESLREISIKQKTKDVLMKSTLLQFIEIIKKYGIKIVNTEINHVKELDKLILHHNDPFDHIIISIAISGNFNLISSDGHFPKYKKQGLQLIEI